ncbi:MAG TPA: cytochrome b N-terminal domain-containing protein [Candidatus Binatus sp.]|jgi:quinol-cytochrome oxidoreductase complex cytochrome b subunit|nr:cytochrome b N-terminal domain-containing protein [Candidatus Binatus sp.]
MKSRVGDESTGSWTAAARRQLERRLPWENLLPDRQPFYVGSWVYVFGVVTIAALVWVVLSGVVLAAFGPQWWHLSSVGRFFNSLHFWSVQVFFVFMVLHLWGQYFMASWREGRAPTWMIGVVTFAISIVAAFTGYLSQQNFDAQYIAMNAKDAVNSTGVGGFFNVLNFGQMYGLHVMLLPIAIIALVFLHIIQVRMKGVVPPIGHEARPVVAGDLRKK